MPGQSTFQRNLIACRLRATVLSCFRDSRWESRQVSRQSLLGLRCRSSDFFSRRRDNPIYAPAVDPSAAAGSFESKSGTIMDENRTRLSPEAAERRAEAAQQAAEDAIQTAHAQRSGYTHGYTSTTVFMPVLQMFNWNDLCDAHNRKARANNSHANRSQHRRQARRD